MTIDSKCFNFQGLCTTSHRSFPTMTDDKFWSDRHARALVQAREERDLEPFKFATQNAISLRQLKELESQGCNSFYSERIKFDVGNRLLRKLGVTLEPLPAPAPEPVFEPAALPTLATLEPLDAPAQAQATAMATASGDPLAPPPPSALTGSSPSGRTRFLLWPAGALALLAAGILTVHPWQRSSDRITPALTAPAPAVTAVVPTAETGVMPAAAAASEVASPLPPMALASAAPAPRRQDSLSSLCQFTGQGGTFTPAQTARAGDYVYLLAQRETRLCLVDATGRETVLTLAAGQSANITGQPPFKLAAAPDAQVQAFYQGQRVAWPTDASYVVLTQAPRSPQP